MREAYAFSIFPRTIFIVLLTMPFCSVNGSGRIAKAAGSQRSGKRAEQVASLRKRSIWDWMIRIASSRPLSDEDQDTGASDASSAGLC